MNPSSTETREFPSNRSTSLRKMTSQLESLSQGAAINPAAEATEVIDDIEHLVTMLSLHLSDFASYNVRDLSLAHLKLRLSLVTPWLNKMESIAARAHRWLDADQLYEWAAKIDDYVDDHLEFTSTLQALINVKLHPSPSVTHPVHVDELSNARPKEIVKLQHIQLAEVEETTEKWVSSKSLVETSLHASEAHDDTPKLHHLVTAMEIPAPQKNVLDGIPVTGENPQSAKQAVVLRYKDKRKVSEYHKSSLPTVKVPANSSQQSRQLQDTFSSHLDPRSQLNHKHDSDDSISNLLIHHPVMKQLDAEVSHEWLRIQFKDTATREQLHKNHVSDWHSRDITAVKKMQSRPADPKPADTSSSSKDGKSVATHFRSEACYLSRSPARRLMSHRTDVRYSTTATVNLRYNQHQPRQNFVIITSHFTHRKSQAVGNRSAHVAPQSSQQIPRQSSSRERSSTHPDGQRQGAEFSRTDMSSESVEAATQPRSQNDSHRVHKFTFTSKAMHPQSSIRCLPLRPAESIYKENVVVGCIKSSYIKQIKSDSPRLRSSRFIRSRPRRAGQVTSTVKSTSSSFVRREAHPSSFVRRKLSAAAIQRNFTFRFTRRTEGDWKVHQTAVRRFRSHHTHTDASHSHACRCTVGRHISLISRNTFATLQVFGIAGTLAAHPGAPKSIIC